VVVPGSAGAPASLVCVNNCPAVYADTSPLAPWATITSLNWGGGGSQTVASNQNWGPVPTANAIGYSYDGMLKAAGSAIDYSHATQTQMQNDQGGLQSGYLIDGSDSVALAGIKCDADGTANTGGANYCPFLANQADTSYQWETGPNQWNQYFGAFNGAIPITFDPPKNLAFTVAADGSNIRAANVLKYAGSTFAAAVQRFRRVARRPRFVRRSGHRCSRQLRSTVALDTGIRYPGWRHGHDVGWHVLFDQVPRTGNAAVEDDWR